MMVHIPTVSGCNRLWKLCASFVSTYTYIFTGFGLSGKIMHKRTRYRLLFSADEILHPSRSLYFSLWNSSAIICSLFTSFKLTETREAKLLRRVSLTLSPSCCTRLIIAVQNNRRVPPPPPLLLSLNSALEPKRRMSWGTRRWRVREKEGERGRIVSRENAQGPSHFCTWSFLTPDFCLVSILLRAPKILRPRVPQGFFLYGWKSRNVSTTRNNRHFFLCIAIIVNATLKIFTFFIIGCNYQYICNEEINRGIRNFVREHCNKIFMTNDKFQVARNKEN